MKKISEQEIIAKGKAHFLCMDCGLDTDKAEQYYMLHNHIWRSIHHHHVGMLCLTCVERRLKRRLVRDDFTSAPVNAAQAGLCAELALRLARCSRPAPRHINRAKRRRRAKRR